jgi:hypothetical protein
MTVSSANPVANDIVALVGDDTPEHLLYGDYRGWVLLDQQGGYLRDMTQAEVDKLTVDWDEWSSEYDRVGTVTGWKL